ncbi:MAG: arginyl-tRNA--protein-N-Asp/Glu arginylyltransferase, partial [Hyphomonas sp.]
MKFTDSQILPAGLERSLRFYVTNPSPCPYLPGMRERKAFTNLAVSDAESIH